MSDSIETVEAFRELQGDAHPVVYDKSVDRVDEHIRAFLAMASFVAVAGIDADGKMDISPKGDPPGFIRVVDERTLVIPERPGHGRDDACQRDCLGDN